MMSASLKAALAPSSFGRYPVIFYVLHEYMTAFIRQYTYSWGGDVRQVSCNAWGIDDIVKCKFGNER